MQAIAQSLVIIPTYNERATLVPLVRKVLAILPETDVLIVDDNSPDGTGRLADRLAAVERRVNVIHRTSKDGLASAYRAGFRHALERGYELITQMDADFSHRPEDLPRLLAGARSADVVVGSRNVAGGRVEDWPLIRQFVSRGGSLYTRTLLRLPIRDCTSGYKCIRRRALASVPIDQITSSGFGFQIEMNYLFHRAGMRLTEAPIVFPNRVAGQSKMSGGIFVEAIKLVCQLRWNHRRRLRPGEPIRRAVGAARALLRRHRGQFARFAIVGGSGVAVNSGLLFLLVEQGGFAPLLAAGVATEASILSNFALNDNWTFRTARRAGSRLLSALRYNLHALGGLALSLAVLGILINLLSIHYLIANLFAIASATLWNYISNTRWTWPTIETTGREAGMEAEHG